MWITSTTITGRPRNRSRLPSCAGVVPVEPPGVRQSDPLRDAKVEGLAEFGDLASHAAPPHPAGSVSEWSVLPPRQATLCPPTRQRASLRGSADFRGKRTRGRKLKPPRETGTPVSCRGRRFCFFGVALIIRAKSLKLRRRGEGEQKAKAAGSGAGRFHPSGWPVCRP
jgi:hypothetical protein